jgi:hypothetical protein
LTKVCLCLIGAYWLVIVTAILPCALPVTGPLCVVMCRTAWRQARAYRELRRLLALETEMARHAGPHEAMVSAMALATIADMAKDRREDRSGTSIRGIRVSGPVGKAAKLKAAEKGETISESSDERSSSTPLLRPTSRPSMVGA